MSPDTGLEAHVLQRGLITERELGEARAVSQRRNEPIEESLVALGFLTEDQVGMLQAEALGVPYVFPHADQVPPELVARFPRRALEEHQAIPLLAEEGRIVLASPVVLAPEARNRLGEACGAEIVQALASKRNVQRVLKRLFPAAGDEAPPPARDPGAVGLVYGHLARALSLKATELRFEPTPDAIRVRYRIEGKLEDRGSEPLPLLLPLVSRLRTLFGSRLRSRPAGASGILRTRIGAEEYRLELTLLATRLGECALLKLTADLSPSQEAPRKFLKVDVVGRTAGLLPTDKGLVLVSSSFPDASRALSYALLKDGKFSGRTIMTLESSSLELRPEFRQVEMAGIRLADALEAALAYEPDVIYVGHVLQWPGEIAATLMAATSRLVLVSTSDASALDTALRWLDCGAPAWLMGRVMGCLVSVSETQDVSVIPATTDLRKALERRAPPDDLRRAAGI